MADIELLKRLAEACDIERCADEEERDRNLNEFYSVLEPEDVAALIAENEALRSSSGFNELALLRMGFRQACEERDQLKAELERVRADAERYRWLRDNDQFDPSSQRPNVRYAAENYAGGMFDGAIDAEMNSGERTDV